MSGSRRHRVRRRLLRALDRVGLLERGYSAYEAAKALGDRSSRDGGADELALPPARLRVRVAGTPDARWFLESGRASAITIRDTAQRHGTPLEAGRRMLDFGCGCGRLTRHWHELSAVEVHGSDRDADAIAWCREHLRFARFTTHGLAPPVPYPDACFDAVCAVSVFTHLPEPLQRPWMAELRRVLAPGGLLIVTVHGDAYVDRLAADELRSYRAGKLAVRWQSAAGRNLCTAFHPPAYVRERMAAGFELLDHVARGMTGTPHQDLVVLRRPSG